MPISNELIRAFFLHQCTPEEAQKVSDYLKANPAEAEQYLSSEEWNTLANGTLLPDAFWDRQWAAIQKEKNKGRVLAIFKRVAVAAIFIIALGVSIFYFVHKAANAELKTADVSQDFRTDENKTQSPQVVTLSDGSVVELMPGATLTYKNGFEKASRDLVLKGEAVFIVAQDKMRPFTVYSGNISTTALGTKFKVVYTGDGSKTKVLLYEGKVVVKSAQATNKKESYLVPGDVLTYQDNIVKVSREMQLKDEVKTRNSYVDVDVSKGRTAADNKLSEVSTAQNNKADKKILIPNWYRFEKESLANVFDQLGSLYNVRIEYDIEQLNQKYFIGKFEKKTTIDNILKTIAGLNNLQVEKISESHFIIK